MRVLLVEDDPMIGSVVQHALRDASYAADWVRDGEAALTTLRAIEYEMVLLDLNLPRIDGMTVLRTLRGVRENVPVLVLTAREATEDRVAGLDGGADDYLVKPFAMSELLARMRALARRKDGRADTVLGNGIV
ncbi:MAG TPA: response regulator, partial [Duganella sp.]|nr:response regulator [Duganella sp.]